MSIRFVVTTIIGAFALAYAASVSHLAAGIVNGIVLATMYQVGKADGRDE